MKRGLVLLVIFALMLPMAMAGQVSDFFKYFTNDAFSLITDAPIVNNNQGSFVPSNIIPVQKPTAGATQASGESCRQGSECRTMICTKINDKGICGKGMGKPCSSDIECYGSKCDSGKCLRGKQGKPCMNANDCEQNLKCNNNRCTPVPKQPAAKTLGIAKVSNPSKDSAPDNSKSLEAEIKKKLSELNSRADAILAKHKNEAGPAKKSLILPQTSLKSSLFPSLTGKFLLAIPMPSVNLFTPPPERSTQANGVECTSSSQCSSGSCAVASSSSSKKYCGLANGAKCTSKAQCASQNCGSPKMVSGKLVSTCQPKPAPKISNPLIRQKTATPTKEMPRQGALKIDGASCQKSADCKSGLCKCTVGKCAQASSEIAKPDQAKEETQTLPSTANLDLSGPSITGMPFAEEVNIEQEPSFTQTKSSATQQKDKPGFSPLNSVAYLQKESGASCSRNEECSSNLCTCSAGKGKCQKFTPFAPPKQAELPRKPLFEKPAEKLPIEKKPVSQLPKEDEKKFNGASWKCYDGATESVSEECKTEPELAEKAKLSCDGKCSAGKCGVNSFSIGQPCEEAINGEQPAEAVLLPEEGKQKCDDSSKESIEKLNKEIKELKKKVCLEASKHRGIDYGDVVCSGVGA